MQSAYTRHCMAVQTIVGQKIVKIAPKNIQSRVNVGILGATGMVGQQLIRMLKEHPWFSLQKLGASPISSGKNYAEAVAGRWWMDFAIPETLREKMVENGEDVPHFATGLDLLFSAINLPKNEVMDLEDQYAKRGLFVISCNSGFRDHPLIPMIIPYVNKDHLDILPLQRSQMGYQKGGIIVKSNCSIKSFVIALEPLKKFGIKEIRIHSEQAISGAGKTFANWPEAAENIIPLISGEEEKSREEPLKLWGKVTDTGIKRASTPSIKAKCVRVGVANGHTAYVQVKFAKKNVKIQEILTLWQAFNPCPHLPSSAKQVIHYLSDPDRPQPRLDVMRDNGMGVTIGQLKEEGDNWFSFTSLSHNAILGAAGGALLAAE